ncbi:MAG: spherulation-specific family 4 protein [Sulfurihydrogenibium sp.]|jgi:hypothetical protein|nr:spherulation-specific family 4 protein [Sulfurihydrogenibium sp.]
MKKAFLITFFIFLVSCGGSSSNSNNPTNTNLNDLTTYIIPLYSYPVGQYQSEWEKLYNLNTLKRVYVIINTSNGPGDTADDKYLDAINKIKAKGFYIIGYVYTNYGDRNLEDVKNDIDKWLSLYGADKIDGFFIDEVSTDVQKFNYYKDVYTFANLKGKLVILNPGTNVDLKFFNISDKIVVFESDETNFEAFQYNNYSSINSDRVCSIVLSTSANKLSFVKDKMLKNNSSCGYITDKADNWQSGDSAYFYLSPYLN